MKCFIILIMVFMTCFSMSITAAHDKVVVIPLNSSKISAQNKLIFVTGSSWGGDLGGPSGAHAKCNAEAKTRGFKGTFQALLGSNDGGPQYQSIHYPIQYVSETGDTLNSSYQELFTSFLDTPVNNNAFYVWTGLDADGSTNVSNCNGWTDSTSSYTGISGRSDFINSEAWIIYQLNTCSNFRRLYCIEQ